MKNKKNGRFFFFFTKFNTPNEKTGRFSTTGLLLNFRRFLTFQFSESATKAMNTDVIFIQLPTAARGGEETTDYTMGRDSPLIF